MYIGGWPALDPPIKNGCPILSRPKPKGWETPRLRHPNRPSPFPRPEAAPSLRMARDRQDGDHRNPFLAPGFIGTVVPEDAISARGVVLRVRLEDFLAIDAS